MRRYVWTTINVRDMEASLSFYRDVLELAVVRRFFPREGVEITFLGHGETQVELVSNAAGEPVHAKNISLGFQVDTLEGMMARLEAVGIPVKRGPMEPNPGIRFFYAEDPDGLEIQFVELRPGEENPH